jgi:thiosulfate/3-mercaptopyruvate sulfurtransferase
MTKFNNIHDVKRKKALRGMNEGTSKFNFLGLLIICLMAIAPAADAGCSCSGGTWDPTGFLNSELGTSQPVQSGSAQDSGAANSQISTQSAPDRAASYPNVDLFKPMKSVSSSDVVIEVSNDDSYYASHIKDAIHIPSDSFLSNGSLKSDEELAAVLGGAGVSRNDSVVLYANKESSGEAEFVYFVLRHLGQKDVKLLDGSLADWQAAGLPVELEESTNPGLEYRPQVVSGVMASYDYVNSDQAQIIDARPFLEFGNGRIPGSIAMDPANLVKEDEIKDSNGLGIVFSRLDRDKPVVVYSNDYSRSSLAAFALQLMGFETSIYTWDDWQAHGASVAEASTATAAEGGVDSTYTRLGRT